MTHNNDIKFMLRHMTWPDMDKTLAFRIMARTQDIHYHDMPVVPVSGWARPIQYMMISIILVSFIGGYVTGTSGTAEPTRPQSMYYAGSGSALFDMWATAAIPKEK